MTDYKAFLKDVNKRYASSVVDINATWDLPTRVIPTGSLQLDRLTGVGGIAHGYVTEIYGTYASGKTTLTYNIVREAQLLGHRVLWVDVEYSTYPRWMANQGVDFDPERFLFAQCEDAEDALDLIEDAIRSEHFGLVVLDSVAGLITRDELAKASVADRTIGMRASIVSRAIGRFRGPLKKSDTAIVFINQEREKIGAYRPTIYRPGGSSLDYFSSLVLRSHKVYEKVEEGKEQLGFKMGLSVFKSRFAGANAARPEILIQPGTGINRGHDLLAAGLDCGLLTRRGSWIYRGDDERLANGERAFMDLIAGDEGRYAEIAGRVREVHRREREAVVAPGSAGTVEE